MIDHLVDAALYLHKAQIKGFEPKTHPYFADKEVVHPSLARMCFHDYFLNPKKLTPAMKKTEKYICMKRRMKKRY